jgi:hypothetical protein
MLIERSARGQAAAPLLEKPAKKTAPKKTSRTKKG